MKRSIKYIALIACIGFLGACDLKEDEPMTNRRIRVSPAR